MENHGEPTGFVSLVTDRTLLSLFKKDDLTNDDKCFIVEHGYDKVVKFVNGVILRGTKCKIENAHRDNQQSINGHGKCDRISILKYRGQRYALGHELHNHNPYRYECGPEQYERNGRSKFDDLPIRLDEKSIVGTLTYSKNVENNLMPKDGITEWKLHPYQLKALYDYLVAMENLMVRFYFKIIETLRGLKKELRKVARRLKRKLVKIKPLYKEGRTKEVHVEEEGLNDTTFCKPSFEWCIFNFDCPLFLKSKIKPKKYDRPSPKNERFSLEPMDPIL